MSSRDSPSPDSSGFSSAAAELTAGARALPAASYSDPSSSFSDTEDVRASAVVGLAFASVGTVDDDDARGSNSAFALACGAASGAGCAAADEAAEEAAARSSSCSPWTSTAVNAASLDMVCCRINIAVEWLGPGVRGGFTIVPQLRSMHAESSDSTIGYGCPVTSAVIQFAWTDVRARGGEKKSYKIFSHLSHSNVSPPSSLCCIASLACTGYSYTAGVR